MPGGREIRHAECAANGPSRRDLQTDFKMHFKRGQAGTAWAFRPQSREPRQVSRRGSFRFQW